MAEPPSEPDDPRVDTSSAPASEEHAPGPGRSAPSVGAREASRDPAPSGGGGAAGVWLIALALVGAVGADALGGAEGTEARGWAQPGAFALLGAVATAVTLTLALLTRRLRGARDE